MFRAGSNLNDFGDGIADLCAGRSTEESEAAAMVVAEALSVYIRSNTKG